MTGRTGAYASFSIFLSDLPEPFFGGWISYDVFLNNSGISSLFNSLSAGQRSFAYQAGGFAVPGTKTTGRTEKILELSTVNNRLIFADQSTARHNPKTKISSHLKIQG
jgi:hypothetical protein